MECHVAPQSIPRARSRRGHCPQGSLRCSKPARGALRHCGLGAGGRGGMEKQEQLQGWGWLAAAEGSRPQQSAGTGAGWEQHSPYSSWKETAHQKHPAASSPASTAAALPAGSNRASGVRTSCLALSWLGGKLLSSCIINFKGHCPFKMNNLPSKGFISPRSRTPTSLDLQPHRHEMYF